MEYYFFLSYANENNDEVEVCKFFNALCEEICRQEGHKEGTPGIGFRDQGELKTGADWQLEMMTALQNSRTLVCLYSPAYFKSRWCGCEWETFRLRRELYVDAKRQAGEINLLPPHVIKPIVWMASERPEKASVIQIFNFKTKDDFYRKAGLFRLIRRHEKYKDDYEQFIAQLASEILKEKELSLPAYPISPDGLLGQIKNPFVPVLEPDPPAVPNGKGESENVKAKSNVAKPSPRPGGLSKIVSALKTTKGKVALVALLIFFLMFILMLGRMYKNWSKPEPPLVSEGGDDLFDKAVDYVTDPAWFWQTADSVGWKIEKVNQYEKRVIKGDRVGLFKNGQTVSSFNVYRDFVMVFDARFSGDKTTDRRIGWVVRAENFNNYYLFELLAAAGEPGRKEFTATRYENGKPSVLINRQVIQNIDNPDNSFEIRTEAIGNRLKVCIRPFFSSPPRLHMQMDAIDTRFSQGGVGFKPLRGKDFQLESLQVIPNPNLAEEGCKP